MRAAAPPETRPRRHRARRWLVAVMVLFGLLVAADRVAVVVAQQAAARTIQNSQHLDSRPSVTVAGFPFLTQLAAAHFRQITISANGLQAGSGSRALRIAAFTVVLHSVRVARDLSRVEADSATATGTISYADLSHTLGITLAYAGRTAGVGRVQASVTVTVLGQSVTGTVGAGVRISGSDLEFSDPAVSAGGAGVPSVALPVLRSAFGAPISLAGLPFGVTVRGVHATPAGITIDLSGAQLVYRRS